MDRTTTVWRASTSLDTYRSLNNICSTTRSSSLRCKLQHQSGYSRSPLSYLYDKANVKGTLVKFLLIEVLQSIIASDWLARTQASFLASSREVFDEFFERNPCVQQIFLSSVKHGVFVAAVKLLVA